MNWNLAVEKNHEALKRILAMLVAMVGMTAESGTRQTTLPRHLHRYVLRLLRPAESATRRLIIIAARGLVVKLPKPREATPRPSKPLLNRRNGYGTGLVIRPGPLPEWAKALVPKRSTTPSLSLLDPMKRFGIRRRYAKPSAMPQIRVLGGDPLVPLFRQSEPPPPPPPTPADPINATRIQRRLEAIGRVLDDLPKQAQRMARWQARRDARWARERGEANVPADGSGLPLSGCFANHLYSEERGTQAIEASTLSTALPRPFGERCRAQRGGEGRSAAKPRRFHRVEPMRPGRPPGWRRKPNHDVYEVLNELHGLAVWARDRRDSS